jgi:hypothetical protein
MKVGLVSYHIDAVYRGARVEHCAGANVSFGSLAHRMNELIVRL